MLGELAQVELETVSVAEEAGERVHDNHVERVLAVTGALDHALELGPLVVGRRGAGLDVLGHDLHAACGGPCGRLRLLVGDRQIVLGLPIRRDAQIDGGAEGRRRPCSALRLRSAARSCGPRRLALCLDVVHVTSLPCTHSGPRTKASHGSAGQGWRSSPLTVAGLLRVTKQLAPLPFEIGFDHVELRPADREPGAEVVADHGNGRDGRATRSWPRWAAIRGLRRALGFAGVRGGLRPGLSLIIEAGAQNSNFSSSLCCRTDARCPEWPSIAVGDKAQPRRNFNFSSLALPGVCDSQCDARRRADPWSQSALGCVSFRWRRHGVSLIPLRL
jgi:hypothetical protein